MNTIGKGRDAWERRRWAEARESLLAADRESPLAAADLDLLWTATYLAGHEVESLDVLERAHHAHVEEGDPVAAVRAAFWKALLHFLRGEEGPGTGWLGRARRLLETLEADGAARVERGYLLIPVADGALSAGDFGAARAAAAEAGAVGERFGDADLVAIARHVEGRALVLDGSLDAGLALLDEAMVAVVSRELSPVVTGLIYCSVIAACCQASALGRAREWTTALARWCEEQPELVAFTDVCLVHRAEILTLQGAWRDALEAARRACGRFSRGIDPRPPPAALYRQGEVHRLRGEHAEAERAYREASRWGRDPQPGLALLRLGQGRTDAAAATIRRALAGTDDPLQRSRLLPAAIEILIAAGDPGAAREAGDELGRIAATFPTRALGAAAAWADGAVRLAAGDALAALGPLRRAWKEWEEIDAPYDAARARELIARACRELGDDESADLEQEAARAAFERLGAAPDLARIDGAAGSPARGGRSDRPHGLTPRERQVLALVAQGRTNKAIARELGRSERTVDRHVSNIFAKLGVSSRAAATAFAYEHGLV